MAMKMRTKTTNGETEVVVLVDHPMETGQRVDPKTKEKIPAHFIQKLVFTLNGKEVAVADLGTGVSKDPLVKIKLRAAKPGDRVKVSWSDNKGEAGEKEIVVGA
ncbi:MAG: thiosulfate oxidation carrier complex protein SoxZ [Sulfurifustaceae bacterium]